MKERVMLYHHGKLVEIAEEIECEDLRDEIEKDIWREVVT